MSDSAFFPPGKIGPRGDAGPRGPQGPVGPGLNWVGGLRTGQEQDGTWELYEPNDAFYYSGSAYVVRQEFQAGDVIPLVTPGWDDYLELLASQGSVGPPGAIGPDGPTGPNGGPGRNGDQGPMGFPGTYADWLDQGNDGNYDDFLAVIRGTDGDRGPSGDPGTYAEWIARGHPHYSGENDPPTYDDFLEVIRGHQGQTGPSGTPGTFAEYEALNPGATYDQFVEVIRGPRGFTGQDGQDGDDGEDGADSTVPGPQGEPGTFSDWQAQPGNESKTYADFQAAFTGAQGIQGVSGFPGTYAEWLTKGNVGTYADFLLAIKGQKGDQGIPGEAGTYQEAMARGFTGSYQDFLNTLKGQQGEPGIQGDTGKQGLPGNAVYKGDQGPLGPIGLTGPSGPRGVNWTGPWDPDYHYVRYDAVSYAGGSYICVTDAVSTTATPSASGDWEALAAKGSAIGVKGPKGDPGAQGIQGIPGVTFTGAWDAGNDYAQYDIATWNGTTYIRMVAGTTPDSPDNDATNWAVFAAKGQSVQGPQGIQGGKGDKGDPGATGPAGAGLNWTGAWDSARAYAVNDVARYNGSSYRRTVAGTTITDPASDAAGIASTSTLTYQADGDTNGIVYAIGTLVGAFATPVPTPAGGSHGAYTLTGDDLAITVTTQQNGFEGWRMVDRANNSAWATWDTGANRAATFDFRTRSVAPTFLSMRSRSDDARYFPVGFALEGSVDNVAWTPLLNVADAGFTATGQWKGWAVAGAAAYRYLRLRQTSNNLAGSLDFQIGEVEFYGALNVLAVGAPNWEVIAAKGAVGAAGPKGDKGDTGAAGAAGAVGAQGPAGAQGPKGDKGDTGDVGPQGPAGSGGGGGASVAVSTLAARAAAATAGVGGLAFLTNVADAKKFIVSDGTHWLNVSDGTISADPAGPVTLTWNADGDTNGVFFYFGVQDPAAFSTPVPTATGSTSAGARVTLNSLTNAAGYSVGHLVDRASTGAGQGDAYSSANAAGQWIALDAMGATFAPTKLSLRHFAESGSSIINFVVEGSNDNAAWTNLLTVNGAAAAASFAWRNWDIAGAGYYRYLRVRQTGVNASGSNFMDIAEWEWYGTYKFNGQNTVLTWTADGDTNGLFYYLGTHPWTVPVPQVAGATTATGSRVALNASGTNGSTLSVGYAVSRGSTGAAGDAWGTLNAANQYIMADFLDRTFAPTMLSMRHYNEAGYSIINFVVEGSADNAAWTTLLTVNADPGAAAFAWRHWAIVGAAAYRYLRVRQTGLNAGGTNVFDLAELEWYGTLAPGY